jgi:hypothetical protein
VLNEPEEGSEIPRLPRCATAESFDAIFKSTKHLLWNRKQPLLSHFAIGQHRYLNGQAVSWDVALFPCELNICEPVTNREGNDIRVLQTARGVCLNSVSIRRDNCALLGARFGCGACAGHGKRSASNACDVCLTFSLITEDVFSFLLGRHCDSLVPGDVAHACMQSSGCWHSPSAKCMNTLRQVRKSVFADLCGSGASLVAKMT